MIPADPYLKTQQVAKALGVSVSTVKRWVDSGVLQAVRTIGKHRLIPREAAERLAGELGLALDRGPAAAEDGPCELRSQPLDDPANVLEALSQALRRGRAREIHELIVGAFHAHGPVALADEVIQPALQHLGHEWEVQNIDVFQEHRAVRVVKMALFQLVQELSDDDAAPGRPLALGAAPEGDPYLLPGLLCELTLRSVNWDVLNLGVNLPLASLAKAVRAHRPRLVWLSVSYLADPARFLADYRLFFEAISKTDSALILGGQALTPELRSRLVAASFGDRMAHLAEFARLLSRPDAAAPVVRPNREPEI